jgi:hypothetical protein
MSPDAPADEGDTLLNPPKRGRGAEFADDLDSLLLAGRGRCRFRDHER